MKVGVMGCGVVGGTVAKWLERQKHSVARYDPPLGHEDDSVLDDCETVFISVPTPFDGKQCDVTLVVRSVMLLRGHKTVIIKSTVTPGTTAHLQGENMQHLFFFVPEFLSEDSADDDYENPLVSMIGVPRWEKTTVFDKARINVRRLWEDKLIPVGGEPVVTSAKVAETYKLMRNAYLATKVVFFNEVYDLCQKSGIDYDKIRLLAEGDPWIRGHHTDVMHKGYRGYGGKCFPKDVNALIAYADESSVDLATLRMARAVNEMLKEKKCE